MHLTFTGGPVPLLASPTNSLYRAEVKRAKSRATTGPTNTSLVVSPASTLVTDPVEATCSSLGSRTRGVKTRASLYHGWWYGMNGVGCQPASSSWMATTGCQLLRNVTPFH